MKRTAQLYLLIVSVVGLGILFILQVGSKLPAPAPALSTQSTAQHTQQITYASDSSVLGSVKSGLWQNASNPFFEIPPVNWPSTAVKASIAAEAKK